MTYTELIKMRVTLYKHLMGTESIITSRISKNNIKKRYYNLNDNFILKHINLNSYTNNYYQIPLH